VTGITALLDANVLYPAPIRDIFLQLAVDDVFRARWTADIHREWIDALLRKEPNRDRARLERTRDLMDRHTRDCLIFGYEELLEEFQLPDPDDRHVLAAAVVGGCDRIITSNLRDFPESAVTPYGIQVQLPDKFLSELLELMPFHFCDAVYKVRSRLKAPPVSLEDYFSTLSRLGLNLTVENLNQFAESL